jgi:tetratricopeptide (TPR) repeat protein
MKHSKRGLITAMIIIVAIGFSVAKLYYDYENKAIDPRIIKARELYKRFDSLAEKQDFKGLFILLDSIEAIYTPLPHYQDSYELGVLYNNRAATWLSMAIYHDEKSLSLDGTTLLSKDTLLYLSQQAAKHSIQLYETWIDRFGQLPEDEIKTKIYTDFKKGLNHVSDRELERFIEKRATEMLEAQLETPRRLSVAYTNLGIVLRHKEDYSKAIEMYQKAMELWDKNLAAENNLNTILGRPHKKQNILQKILPPDKSQ